MQKNSSEQDAKFTSPFMQQISRQASMSPRDSVRAKKQRVASKINNLPPIQYRGRSQGFMDLFRACKKMKAKRNGRDFKEEYLLLRKRARSQEAKKLSGHHVDNSQIQSYRDEFDLKKGGKDAFGSMGADMDDKQMTVRAKSI